MNARILFSEGSSLTAREFLSVLGPAGHHIEIVDPNPACICRFSRWTKHVHRCPPAGIAPLDYLKTVSGILAAGTFDVLLATHEQAWLFAVAGTSLNSHVPVAVASAEAFSRVESKLEFARLLDELKLPQPEWRVVESAEEFANWPTPFFLKAPFSTAGIGVRYVPLISDGKKAFDSVLTVARGGPIMVQSAAKGEYAQVQAMFDHGHLVAVHTSAQTKVGIGQSAAARIGVDHPFARRDIGILGEHLGWHGGLTIDYMFSGRDHVYIECNPRTVEPANAAASGINFPELQIALSLGEKVAGLRVGHPGIRTHGLLAILLGTAAYRNTRRAVFAEVLRLLAHRGAYKSSRECLTPVIHDLPSLIPLAVVTTCALLLPRSAGRLARAAVKNYSITSETMKRLDSRF